MKKTITGSSLIYVLLVILLTSVVGYIVLTKIDILSNNINMGENSIDLYNSLFDKGNIALDSNTLFNTNGGGKYKDFMSCPQEVHVFSREYDENGDVVVDEVGNPIKKEDIITTEVQIDNENLFCKGYFAGEEIRMYFSTYGDETPFFTNIYKNGILKSLDFTSDSSYTLIPNILDTVGYNKTATKKLSGTSENNIDDGNINTYLKTDSKGKVEVVFDSPQKVSKILLKKPSWKTFSFKYIFNFDDIVGATEIEKTTFWGWETERVLDLAARNLNARLKSFTIESTDLAWVSMFISELEVEGYSVSEGDVRWTNEDHFPPTPGTSTLEYVEFTTDTINLPDGIDDDLNSDDFHVSSLGGENRHVYYPNTHYDDDTQARKVFIGSIAKEQGLYNIFWNNHKTDAYIQKNTNNIDRFHKRIFEVSDGRLYLDLFDTNTYDYNIKILEISKEKYETLNTILINKVYYGNNIHLGQGFISLNTTGGIELSPSMSDDNFSFDFANKNYAIFLENNTDNFLVYELTAQDAQGTPIYINPIDDSKQDTMEVLVNHIMTGGGKNYIGKNFRVERKKIKTNGISYNTDLKAKTCKEILDAGKSEGDGNYLIYPTSQDTPMEVYCDMTTDGGGWTQYVNISGNYNFEDAKKCWLGTKVITNIFECFNPNRFGFKANELMNKDWSGTYTYTLPSSIVSTNTQTPSGSYRCLGHPNYMTVMSGGSIEPTEDLSNVRWIRLGGSYCLTPGGRNPGGRYISKFMNFSTKPNILGETAERKRMSVARTTALYFR